MPGSMIDYANSSDSSPELLIERDSFISKSQVEKPLALDHNSGIVRSSIGGYSAIACFTWIADTVIGRYCSIGSRCTIGPHDHPTNWLSTSAMQYKRESWSKKDHKFCLEPPRKTTFIENDVWIGDNAFIKSGITLGTGCVVGAGSVVVKDVMPYEIVAGNPATVKRRRFDEQIICRLLASEWWKLDEPQLSGCPFSDIEKALEFLEKIA